MKLSKEKLKQIIKEELEAAMDEGWRGAARKLGRAKPQDRPHVRRKRPPMTDEEADAKHASDMAAIVAALKSEYGDRVKTVKISGEKAEDLVQAIKKIDPTADVAASKE